MTKGKPTPICPKCGSADVELSEEGKRANCQTCGYWSRKLQFLKHVLRPEAVGTPKTKWRDPVALLPGDYEDNI